MMNMTKRNARSFQLKARYLTAAVFLACFVIPPTVRAADTDGDALPDPWEITHFGNITSQDMFGDPDDDGIMNYHEWARDSDPNVGASEGTLFLPKVSYDAGNQNQSLVVGDFNGDGKQDLASAPITGSTLDICLGNGDGTFDKASIFADKLPFPMGGTFHNGSLYVAASPNLLKITDTDQDGISDTTVVVLTGWTLNSNGAILSGPFMGPDGYFYLADARRSFETSHP